jgi:hypothetical protein
MSTQTTEPAETTQKPPVTAEQVKVWCKKQVERMKRCQEENKAPSPEDTPFCVYAVRSVSDCIARHICPEQYRKYHLACMKDPHSTECGESIPELKDCFLTYPEVFITPDYKLKVGGL